MAAISDPIEKDKLEIPSVESPYAGKNLTNWEHIKISAYWFATNFVWGPLLLITLPTEMGHMAPYHKAIAVGLVTGLAALVALVVPLVYGAVSDRCASPWGRRRPYMAWGIGINLIGFALMGIAYLTATPIGKSSDESYLPTVLFILANPSFLIFFLAYIVVQFGNNMALAAYSGIIPDLVSHDQRGAASGYMAMMSQGGTFAGMVVIGVVLANFNEGLKYGALGFVLLGASLITLLGIKETPLPAKPPKIQWGAYLKSLWIDPRKYPDFAWVWITRALVMVGFYAVLPFLPYYLGDIIGVKDPEKTMTFLSVIILVLASVSGIFGGVLSDKIGRKKVVYIANSMIAAVSVLFIFCRNILEVMVAGVFFGLGYGAYISVDWALGTDVLPSKNDAAKEMAVWHIAMTLPQSLAIPIAAALIEAFGVTVVHGPKEVATHYTLAGYSAMFLFCGICFSLGAFFLRNVRSVR